MIWEPFVLALFLGLIVSAGLYFAYMWPSIEPLEEPAPAAVDSRAHDIQDDDDPKEATKAKEADETEEAAETPEEAAETPEKTAKADADTPDETASAPS